MDIEASKDGVKLSYKRFLADSAPGYLAILLIALAAAAPNSYLPLIFKPIFDAASHLANQHEHIRDFALLVVFLLGPPLGLLLNATSFMLLRGAHDVITGLLLQRKLKKSFSLVTVINKFEEAVEQLDAGRFSSLEHVHGVQMMSRTIALVAALAAWCLGWPGSLVFAAFLIASVLRTVVTPGLTAPNATRARGSGHWLNVPEYPCALIFTALTLFLLSAATTWPFPCVTSGSAMFGLAALGFTILSGYLRAHALTRVLDIASWVDLPTEPVLDETAPADSAEKSLRQIGRNLAELRDRIATLPADELLRRLGGS